MWVLLELALRIFHKNTFIIEDVQIFYQPWGIKELNDLDKTEGAQKSKFSIFFENGENFSIKFDQDRANFLFQFISFYSINLIWWIELLNLENSRPI